MAAVASAHAQEDAFYAKIIGLRDAVLAGTHPTFRLPDSVVEELKASLATDQPHEFDAQDAFANGTAAVSANVLTNSSVPVAPSFAGLPGLFSSVPPVKPTFPQKPEDSVKEGRRVKRRRIEQALNESDKRARYAGRDRDTAADPFSHLDVDAALLSAQERVKPISGLKLKPDSAKAAADNASSFDENDYYSSQVESAWSSEDGSQQGVGAFTADFERLDETSNAVKPSSKALGKRPDVARNALNPPSNLFSASQAHPHVDSAQLDGYIEEADADDEDEEYSPPEPAAFDSFREEDITLQDTMIDDADDDDDDEYEPGEVTQESAMVTPYNNAPAAQASPNVPVPTFHNRLTHIAAPQPNRVSPLAMQKGPSLELELVNGRPEVVHKPQRSSKRLQQQVSRVSSASPSGPGNGPMSKKESKKAKLKRKREVRDARSKKRQERQHAQSPPSPAHRDPYIKPEPVSPPPFSNVPEVHAYGQRYAPQTAPIELDSDSPRYPPHPQYAYAPAPRYEYAPRIASPQVVRVSSAMGYQPRQRDTQDLRRVTSLHHAPRPASPPQSIYSPVASSHNGVQGYGQPRQMSVAPASDARYQEPLRLQEYRESSSAMMPPPSAAPPRRIVVDQYGNRYYAAEAAPPPRASMAPPAREPESEVVYERAASRMSVVPQQPTRSTYYEQAMPPPLPPTIRQPPPVEYVDANGYNAREYSTRPTDSARYSVAPTSPAYQQTPQYGMMPPPPPSAREVHYEPMPPPPAPQPPQQPTSPMYPPPHRSFSVRPDGYEGLSAYAPRQQSVAPVQYVRQDAPQQPAVRDMSVAPGSEYGMQSYEQRVPSYAPQPAVNYVDQYGREVMPQEVRQVSQYRY